MASEQNIGELRDRKNKRTIIKSSVTRTLTYLRETSEASLDVLLGRRERLTTLLNSYEEIQCEIESLDPETNYDTERDNFERQYFETLGLLDKRVRELRGGSTNLASGATIGNSSNNITVKSASSLLPQIKIKNFDGNPIHWQDFYDSFKSLVHDNHELPASQKFHLLKNSLVGDVTSIVESLNANEENYLTAWELLQERCNKPRQIVNAHLKLLLELPEITRDSPTKLQLLCEQVQKHVKALNRLGQPTHAWDAFLVFIVTRKLDKVTRRSWERTLENEEIPEFEQLIKFIKKQARGDDLDIEKSMSQKFNSADERLRVKPHQRQSYVATTKNNCIVCQERHELRECERFRQLPARERLSTVKRAKLCINCLRGNHPSNNCRWGNCRKCDRKHNTLLHIDSEYRKDSINNPDTNSTANVHTGGTTLTVACDSEVLLGTARISILDKFGRAYNCRVLLDGGSQTHFITQRLADKLQLDKHEIDLSFFGLGRLNTRANHYVNATIKSRNNSFEATTKFVALPSITGILPVRKIDHHTLAIPRKIVLADPEFYKPGEIDILLGNTLFYELLSTGQIKLANNAIILQETRLGWIVTGEGKIEKQSSQVNRQCLVTTVSLDKLLNKFWEIEEIPNKTFLSKDETTCENYFKASTSRETNGCYTVKLPFNDKRDLLIDSRTMALKRFYSLERKLSQNPVLSKQYSEFLKEYETLGHMTEVINDQPSEGFYLPHHAVVKESSATTKLRVVFDASAKDSSGLSLNDTLLSGPTIQDTLFSILLRFRSYAFVLTADIEKMFRQIKVHPSDTMFQKILWRESREKPIKVFKLNTVTYGTTCAPFLAIRCLHQLADDEGHNFPRAAQAFKKDFYVDDLLTGTSDFESALSLRNELRALAKLGSFNLRQWSSNDINLIKDLHTDNKDKSLCLDMDETKKTLGIFWNSTADTLTYNLNPFENKQRFTKRTLLSEIAQLFDPLGLLGPVVIKAKIIMQQVWKDNIGWDNSVSYQITTDWTNFRNELIHLNNFKVPRNVIIKKPTQIQLHGFCDASEAAYGACIYIRTSDNDKRHTVNLLCAKSRVAPLKTISLPRLELCAATVLVKLYKEVVNSISNFRIDKTQFWSDSSIALQWIKTPPHLLKTFVANRVSEIQSNTDFRNWNHISSSDNPADYISRGQSPLQLLHNSHWLRGPKWLSQDEQVWPQPKFTCIDIPEKREIISLTVTTNTNELLRRYSSIDRLNHVVAYIIRFRNNTRQKVRITGELKPSEIHESHSRIIRILQAEVFSKEIGKLKQGKSLSAEGKILSLNPFLDDNGILRVGGRLKHAPISYSQKHPILLPRSHHITDLIIRKEHIRHWHAGTQATLSAVRQNYWPIDGKNITRRIIHKCIRCCKINPKFPKYVMGNLPETRITQTRPFLNTGVDYCGPYFIKEKKLRNRNKVKIYVAIFVCFATKATHLELVSDLTTDACIAAMKRFFARRGKALNMYSDNGTNFVGAKNEIMKIQAFLNSEDLRSNLQHFLTHQNICWHFSPPRSPHFGGLWEATVKSFKRHFYRTVGNALFTYEQFDTLIIEIEAILNSRPLIPLSSDPNDLIALTPAHFLIGDSLSRLPEYDLTNEPKGKLSLWQHLQSIKQHFWARWHKEYLHELHTRQKWHLGNPASIQEGMLVTVKEDNLPPLYWKLGRIISTHPGEDNIVRVATVRTATGTYKRSVKLLSPLPLMDM